MAADAEGSNPAKSGRGGADIPFHPLVTKLLGAAGEPQDFVTLVGYIGPSKKEGHVRLYTGLDFQTYYEVPREGIASTEAVDRADDNSPTRLMIHADATIEVVQTSKQSGPASYLAGSIAGTYLAGAAAASIPAAVLPIPTRYTICRCWITVPTQCHCTWWQCPGLTAPPICLVASGGVACPPIPPEGPGGGPVEGQAQAAMYAYAASAFCPSWAIPCRSQGIHCPSRPCPVTQAPVEAAMYAFPATVACPSYAMPCLSQQIHCPSRPCPVTQAPVEAAAPQAAALYGFGPWSLFCRTIVLPCVTIPHCGTPACPQQQAATPEGAAAQAAVYPTLICPSVHCPSAHCPSVRFECTMGPPCTLHHGCPTAAVLC
jgi:hypothetical protein